MNATKTITALFLTTLLAACGGASQTSMPGTGTPPGSSAPGAQDVLSGEWTGKFDDMIDFTGTLKLQNGTVTGRIAFLGESYDVSGSWSASSGRLTFQYPHRNGLVRAQGTVQAGSFQGTYTVGNDPASGNVVMRRTAASPGETSSPVPYTMKGTVKNSAGQPLAGVEVWADNTLYYNMNVVGRTDAQGRYSLSLPRDQVGTWQAGGTFKTVYHGTTYELGMKLDNDAAFATDAGAIRNFTVLTSGEKPGGGYYGGTVWVYGNYKNGDFKNRYVELTLTPDGPLLDGSAGETLKRFVDGNTVVDVPIGRYTVTARYLPEGGSPQPMLVMRQDEDTFAPSTTLMFRKEPQYGIMADFNLQLAPR